MSMTQNHVDPCLYYWQDMKVRVILMAVVHVDDVILVGQKKKSKISNQHWRKDKIIQNKESCSNIWESGMSRE
jgi:hypothetical protein